MKVLNRKICPGCWGVKVLRTVVGKNLNGTFRIKNVPCGTCKGQGFIYG